MNVSRHIEGMIMDYCLFIVHFFTGLTTFSAQCFATPDERRMFIREENQKPGEWLSQLVTRRDLQVYYADVLKEKT